MGRRFLVFIAIWNTNGVLPGQRSKKDAWMQREYPEGFVFPKITITAVVVMCHIPCMSTSNTAGFPGATIRAGSRIVKPRSGWTIHILSVKLVMFCIESCTREDWF